MMLFIGMSHSFVVKKAADLLHIPTHFYPLLNQPGDKPFYPPKIDFNIPDIRCVVFTIHGIEHVVISYFLNCPAMSDIIEKYYPHLTKIKKSKNKYDFGNSFLDIDVEIIPLGVIERMIDITLESNNFFNLLFFSYKKVVEKYNSAKLFYLPMVPVPQPSNHESYKEKPISIKIHELIEQKRKQAVEALGIKYLDKPQGVTDKLGFLKTEFVEDPVHANLNYGKLQLDQILSLL